MDLVAGLGMSGESVLRYLTACGERMCAFDTRENIDLSELKQRFAQVSFAQGRLPKAWIKQVKRVILSPGIARTEPWVVQLAQAGAEIIGDIELFARSVSAPVIAITGSNGKSSVTTLVSACLRAEGYEVGMGGNIGIAALDLLLDERDYDVFVLELSSFQLETTYSLHSASSVVLNISEDHMDRYAHLQAYIQAKNTIYQDTELAVVPRGYEDTLWVTQATPRVCFALSPPRSAQDYGVIMRDQQAWLARGNEPLVAVAAMRLNAPHHQLNALAAMALCQPFAVSAATFAKVLADFSGLAHRTQWVAQHQGVDWIDDSKGTNVGATLAAIESFGCQLSEGARLILLAGGVGKEADFAPLAPALARYGRCALLYGRDAPILAHALQGALAVEQVGTLFDAIERAMVLAQPGDVVLFSPACASFDQFKNYQDRGEQFARAVKARLAREEA